MDTDVNSYLGDSRPPLTDAVNRCVARGRFDRPRRFTQHPAGRRRNSGRTGLRNRAENSAHAVGPVLVHQLPNHHNAMLPGHRPPYPSIRYRATDTGRVRIELPADARELPGR